MRNIYLYRLIEFVSKKFGILKHSQELKSISMDKLYPRISPDDYRNNLVRIAELAKERKITLIFMLLKDNPIQTRHLKDGIKFLEEAQYNLAIKNLTIAAKLNNEA